jgi:hypothetical protein
MTLIEYVCQDVLNVIRFSVLIGYKVRRRSAMLLEMNERASSSKRTRHIEIWYYYVADWVAKGDLRVVWCPADEMIADFLTKPLQGKAFVKFWDLLMEAVWLYLEQIIFQFRFGALLGTQVHHRSVLGRCRHCSGNYKAWGASGRKYEARIVIFRILAVVDRFSWISWKAESHQGKSESHWKKRKAIEESRKPLKKVGKPLRKIGFRARKIGFQEGKIWIFPKRFSSIWQFWRLVFLRNLLPCVRMDLLCWTQVITTKIKSS